MGGAGGLIAPCNFLLITVTTERILSNFFLMFTEMILDQGPWEPVNIRAIKA